MIVPKVIKDNSSIEGDVSSIQKTIEKVANQTLSQLEKSGVFVFPTFISESEDLDKNQMILWQDGETWKTGNVMGFLGIGEERLIIQSRFSNGGNDFFFQHMLSRVVSPNIVNMDTDSQNDNQIYNLLVLMFPFYFKEAMRKGIYKTYIKNEYNDENVKGIIDIKRHIKTNTPFVGKISYSKREYSYDNYLTELIRHTIEFIKTKPYGKDLLKSVKDEIIDIENATSHYRLYDVKRIIDINITNRIRHAYYYEYRTLQELCILILLNQQNQIGFGNHKINGILFDGAWLWEEYINTLIKEKFWHPMNKARKYPQQLFKGENRKVGLIYPDFISKDSNQRIIADAKYKLVNDNDDNIHGSDYLQILAYMYRFDSSKGVFIFPGNTDKQLFLNQGSTFEKVEPRSDIYIKKIGLKIPSNVENYNEFSRIMIENESSFMERLYNC